MKICSNKYCTEVHDTKYKLCEMCREDSRNRNRNKRNSKIGRVLDVCYDNQDLKPCQDIIDILEVKQ